jgi:hypothetical protein
MYPMYYYYYYIIILEYANPAARIMKMDVECGP